MRCPYIMIVVFSRPNLPLRPNPHRRLLQNQRPRPPNLHPRLPLSLPPRHQLSLPLVLAPLNLLLVQGPRNQRPRSASLYLVFVHLKSPFLLSDRMGKQHVARHFAVLTVSLKLSSNTCRNSQPYETRIKLTGFLGRRYSSLQAEAEPAAASAKVDAAIAEEPEAEAAAEAAATEAAAEA
ncbi:hypothetical protein K435DRAFT_461388 [Dendrothele bispora CBS 962.96]|uniref:Uncharacterized protein n=1 Tax=Dendrothele bispora (strain CBS 962.96) TaxID=1314807 RepID=A0A4S8MD24_DENBC|nr:hypothetical protein K435DRAFT_461388 [Dendrothele bispora CBS 962.96]